MKKNYLLLFFIAITMCLNACTKSDDDNGGDDPHATACEELGLKKSLNKIINGKTCNDANSAIVLLDITDLHGNLGICSGTIISSDTVLTAAHCFLDGVAAVQITTGGKKYNATSVFIHPQYGTSSSNFSAYNTVYDKNDIALVKIAGSFHIAPMPIVTSRNPSKGETLIVAGYGEDENKNSEQLKAAYMKVSDSRGYGFFLPYDETHTNVCFGDSGGPAFGYVNGVLGVLGITSAGTVSDCLAGDITFFPGLNYADNKNFILANTTPKQI